MTREKFDQFTKDLLRTVLEPLGTTHSGLEIPGEPLEVDVAFEASSEQSQAERDEFGLPGRLIASVALFEPYRRSLEIEHLWNGAAKLSWTWLAARRKVTSSREMNLLPLWIVTPSAPSALMADFGCRPAYLVEEQGLHADWWVRRTWPEGIYRVARLQPLGLVVLNELPEVRETLTLRLMARGRTLKRAIDEVRGLGPNDPLRSPVLHLLMKWRIVDLQAPEMEPEEQEASMYSQMTYDEWAKTMRDEGMEKGIEEGMEKGMEKGIEKGMEKGMEKGQLTALREAIQRFWQRRFGPVPKEVQARLEACTRPEVLESAVDILADARTGAEAEAGLMKALEPSSV